MYQKIRSFFLQSVRVWKILRRPTAHEYATIAKVSALGILILGFLGFAISLIMKIIV